MSGREYLEEPMPLGACVAEVLVELTERNDEEGTE